VHDDCEQSVSTARAAPEQEPQPAAR